ncbi:MAG TPA: SUMF1/EgtB/PvdO family nonheme iron enzyme [Tepidisphaeraceae bacterium]|jgi:formylglycine-generating enzyme required for sulfatase activity|nr:SUMF1/EgtB/PvdO family nonheme iron enzyme [Tepidisphaeraceae bacterium]
MQDTTTWALRALCAASLFVVGISSADPIQFVTIGDPGNAADPANPSPPNPVPAKHYGAVNYSYQIGKYEITEQQYVDFLNAVGKTDTHSLFSFGMFPSFGGSDQPMFSHITQSGSAGNLSYSVPANYANLPMNYLTSASSFRYANWLTNGQPTGLQTAATTEAGSYDLSGLDASTQTIDQVTRSANAKYVVPTTDEWYKAAYYNPATHSYFLYATGTNISPGFSLPDVNGNNANENVAAGSADPTLKRTPIGSYVNTHSPYGVFDMDGNVYEMTESLINGQAFNYMGGGYNGNLNFQSLEVYFQPFIVGGGSPMEGLRIALVPEPASMAVLCLTGLGFMTRRSRR